MATASAHANLTEGHAVESVASRSTSPFRKRCASPCPTTSPRTGIDRFHQLAALLPRLNPPVPFNCPPEITILELTERPLAPGPPAATPKPFR